MTLSLKQLRTPDHPMGHIELSVEPRRWFFQFRFVDPLAREVVESAFAAPLPRAEKAATRVRDAALQFVLTRAHHVAREGRFNLFQRMRLAVQVQNRLVEKGVPADLSRRVALGIASGAA